MPFSIRTFKRDRESIKDLFGIEIKPIRVDHTYLYQIEDDDDEVSDGSITKLLESFTLYQALGGTKQKADFIHFESRKPTNMCLFDPLVKAIEASLLLKIAYHKFNQEFVERKIEPYGLKEFKNRWYLIGRDADSQFLKTFALDRIEKVSVLDEHFLPKNRIDLKEHYADLFGIISPDDNSKKQQVVLSFEHLQGKYIKSLPLHSSQEILIDNEKELRIGLELYITYDFIMELLSYGHTVTVLEPAELIDELKWRTKLMAGKYN